jgi:hypothetical protein
MAIRNEKHVNEYQLAHLSGDTTSGFTATLDIGI